MSESGDRHKEILQEPSFPEPFKVLKELFEKARAKDEFEFGCTLLRIRGCQDAGWDPLIESDHLIHQTVAFLNSPIDELFRRRLMLFLYCHLCEMDEMYRIVANMIRVCQGERYHMDAVNTGGKLPKGWDRTYDCMGDALRVSRLARDAGFDAVGDIFESALIRPVRNGFFHSQYTLFDDEFRLTNAPPLSGKGLKIGYVDETGAPYNTQTSIVPFEWLVPRIQLAINTALAVMNLVTESRRSYRECKKVQGRMGHDGGYVELTLLADENGLYGFQG
ncbi:hypothetical protein FCG40_03115 [Fimbriimonadia bacterium ATM]|nr:MAG: hypothetical protein EDM73_05245 [Armatimonadota bacterium]MBC6969270.1 hypothetical protein [Armatimonadota bacterium]MCE7899391.1 hypothetical protein [Armatimonadetes bacterium ATM1]MDL1927966.1 hypothetical protein [Fimbriimonadia bacterium ATM]RIJ97444.1 MAG: hypothetical protein DCC45_05305 [Armatimonadota bacterium]